MAWLNENWMVITPVASLCSSLAFVRFDWDIATFDMAKLTSTFAPLTHSSSRPLSSFSSCKLIFAITVGHVHSLTQCQWVTSLKQMNSVVVADRVTPKMNNSDAMELGGRLGEWLARWMELDGQAGRWVSKWMDPDGLLAKWSSRWSRTETEN